MIADAVAVIILCFVYLKFWPGYARLKNLPHAITVIPLVFVLFVVAPVVAFHNWMAFRSKVPISSDCQLVSKTVPIPCSGAIHVIWFQSDPNIGRGALAKFTGPIGTNTTVTVGKNPFVYRCDIINHGSTTIFNVGMDLDVKYRKVVDGAAEESEKHKFALSWPISVSEISAGKENRFSFYISNNSQDMVFVTLPATVHYKGSNGNVIESELTQPNVRMVFPPAS